MNNFIPDSEQFIRLPIMDLRDPQAARKHQFNTDVKTRLTIPFEQLVGWEKPETEND